jgi:hypothetical protein
MAGVACIGPSGGPAPPAPLELPLLGGPAARPALVVLVSISGLTPERYREDGADAMPTLRALARAGVSADAVASVTPALAYPAHATLVTGELPATHGITSDHLLGAQGVRAARFTHATSLRKPTLWQRATEAGLSVAALAWPTTVGAEIALRLPDLEPARSSETWLGVLADAATPSLLTLASAAGGDAPAANAPGPVRDRVLVSMACSLVESPAPPRLLLLRLSQTERPLLEFGPGSPEADAAFARADAELAQLFACLSRGPGGENVALLVAGDHGAARPGASAARTRRRRGCLRRCRHRPSRATPRRRRRCSRAASEPRSRRSRRARSGSCRRALRSCAPPGSRGRACRPWSSSRVG